MTSFHIETYGCSHNFADSEQMAGLLKQAKFELKEKLEDADVVIFNTCTVKSPTESAFFSRLEEIKNNYPYKIIIIAGCIPQADPEKLKNFSLLGTRNIHHIVEVVEESLNDNVVKMLESGEMPPLNLPKVRKNPVVEIIPINRGCLSACSFCKTKQARGNLQSYPVKDIVEVAEKAVREGVKEIWLTSQDTLCYGFDFGTNLPQLLQELVKIPGNFKIRIGMGNPVHLRRIQEELFAILQHEKIFKFLHLPLQAGSNEVLKHMRRGNTREEYVHAVTELKARYPELTFATDIIVGYPTETEEDFWQTQTLLREISPDVVNISKFWPRAKTLAAKLPPLSSEVVAHRSKIVIDLFHNISSLRNERWLGWEGEIIVDEKGREEGQWFGRNFAYKPVLVEGNFKLGDKVKVKIEKTTMFDLRGKVL